MAHHKNFSVGLPPCPFVETQCVAVKPTGAWLHVVPKRQTEIFELTDFLTVLVAKKVNHMGYTHGLELLHVNGQA